ncbi:MAG TPA: glycerol-3-phosphate acyltransferase, partial [Verrucomicrobiae bacterium]|nr:glycerol-3-phosphate acyltransferase [Verrucomicrobiae bacterium]
MEQLQSAHWGTAAAIAGGAYALGCFTTGYYLARGCAGKDIREFGSGNVGARNVGRAFGVWGFLA